LDYEQALVDRTGDYANEESDAESGEESDEEFWSDEEMLD